MEEKIFVFSVKRYNFTNDSGESLSGCTVHYYPGENCLETFEDNDQLGHAPLKASMPVEFFEDAQKVGIPCSAVCSYVMRQQQGQMVLKPDKIVFCK